MEVNMDINDNITGIQDECEYLCNEIDDVVIDNIISSYSDDFYSMQQYNSPTHDTQAVQNVNQTNITYDFNPDEFLNFLPEIQTTNEVNRTTPSPTNSSSAASSISDSTFPCEKLEQNLCNNIFDTPPISPENEKVNSPKNYMQCNNLFFNEKKSQLKKFENATTGNPAIGDIKCTKPVGKLTKICFKKPNKLKTNNEKTKMILLPAKDFTNFVKKCKNDNEESSFPRVIIKSSDFAKNLLTNTVEISSKNKFSNSIQSNPHIIQHIPAYENCSSVTPTASILQKKIVPILPANMQNQIFCLNDSKSSVNEEQLKRYERMIKNRKSASLSRMKKKMYVCTLENKVKELGKENCNLKTENTVLRSQLETYKSQCRCSNNLKKTYNFIDLSDINVFNKRPTKHITNINKILFNSPKLKKNTAVLLGMLFMVTLNFGTFNNFFLPSKTSLSKEEYLDLNVAGGERFSNYQFEHIGKRSLLWVNDADTKNNSKSDKYQNLIMQKNNSSRAYWPCPLNINQTENVRLAHTLQKWIDDNDYFNLSSSFNRLSNIPSSFKNDFLAFDDLYADSISHMEDVKLKYRANKNYFFNKNGFQKGNKKAQLKKGIRNFKGGKDYENGTFGPKTNGKYSKLFENLNRREDTFYIVSFNTEHILLPAFAYNKSSRPKMSLMLPDGDSVLNGKITLMQIDCEVVNTTVVDLKEDLIPQGMRTPTVKLNENPQKTLIPDINKNLTENRNKNFKAKAFQNIYMTVLSKPTIEPDTKSSNENEYSSEEKRKKSNKLYKPYFMNNN
ncbi:cyclic AMP-dependent transcription factor ATF-6 alpha [Condylostylus longicornis]|uniref:cyclic AMP-dependent transcription factor ATF-6 alpha n=1 Tax=Condylostylus longicornis TaxID=2530218 RepID=UPI00244E314B|nr:cyclic AMP-dependent transcription factor ATF-6 alpha [Condylostylus longicornis]